VVVLKNFLLEIVDIENCPSKRKNREIEPWIFFLNFFGMSTHTIGEILHYINTTLFQSLFIYFWYKFSKQEN
jgi:hypothetical protein